MESLDNWEVTQAMKDAIRPTWQLHKDRRAALPQDVQDKLNAAPTEEQKAQMMANMAQWFGESDADQDGVLNADEFLVFRKKFTDAQVAMAGGSAILSAEEDKVAWAGASSIDPSYEGLKMIDFMKVFKVMGELAKE